MYRLDYVLKCCILDYV
ncbi:hypothetical protein F383_26074 [Gossypium arboreum]|uniref:Uncharacterized protein n=1 Tax=Gossypium arboreum TaxID=29729 RepID=A0A0B0MRG0_GOSAR|nr:hypothetical protein F383_26074 [Gossypium arboreum]